MGLFNEQDNLAVSAALVTALKKTAEGVQKLHEEQVHIPGYGMCDHGTCQREAEISSNEASKHSKAGDHGKAFYYHERAAMFHRALHSHAQSQLKTEEKSSEIKELPKQPQTVVQSGTVSEEKKDETPHEGRVASKFKRARRMKDKKDHKEDE